MFPERIPSAQKPVAFIVPLFGCFSEALSTERDRSQGKAALCLVHEGFVADASDIGVRLLVEFLVQEAMCQRFHRKFLYSAGQQADQELRDLVGFDVG